VTDDFGMSHEVPLADPASVNDSVIIEGDLLDYIQQQSQVVALAGTADAALQGDAINMLKQLNCDQKGTFTDKGNEVVMGDPSATTISVILGSFSVYWKATCEVGPKVCCVKSTTCDSGYESQVDYICRIKWTQYDVYNFGSSTGTGGSGWLKKLNPIGWAGTSFHDFGYWDSVVTGKKRMCMAAN
jgi:hypothetical protein